MLSDFKLSGWGGSWVETVVLKDILDQVEEEC